MTKTALAQDDEWWRQVFTEAEYRELERVFAALVAEFETDAPEVHEVYFTVPLGRLVDTIKAAYAWAKNEADTEEMQTVVGLMWLVGEALTEVYYWDENLPPEETATAAYRFWRGMSDDDPIEWETGDDDDTKPDD